MASSFKVNILCSYTFTKFTFTTELKQHLSELSNWSSGVTFANALVFKNSRLMLGGLLL